MPKGKKQAKKQQVKEEEVESQPETQQVQQTPYQNKSADLVKRELYEKELTLLEKKMKNLEKKITNHNEIYEEMKLEIQLLSDQKSNLESLRRFFL